MRSPLALSVLLPPAVMLSALSGATAPTTSPTEIVVTATDFSFDVPERVEAGLVTIRLVNRGETMHHAQLLRLDDGHTVADLRAALAAGDDPAWAKPMGGPNVILPGMEARASVVLRAGGYAWVCWLGAGESSHVAQGMVHGMTVEGAGGGELPRPTALVRLSDYDFAIDPPLSAGNHVIRVRNTASQPHELVLVRLQPGRTAEDLLAWLETEEGPPPGMPIGGVVGLAQGEANNIEVTLEPGAYALLCFVPDRTDGRPHVMHGMAKTIMVE